MNTASSVFAILFLVGGTWSIWSQRAPFRSWQPVPARVVDQSVERESSLLDDLFDRFSVGRSVTACVDP